MADKQHTLYLGLGGNVGDSNKIFDQAIDALKEKMTIQAHSSRQLTKAMYVTNQEDFLNMAVKVQTVLDVEETLIFCKHIEIQCGRDLSIQHHGPRSLDIDLLYYDDRIIRTEHLTVPHPLIHERPFVLEPLAEIIDLEFRDPVSDKNIVQMLDEVRLPKTNELQVS